MTGCQISVERNSEIEPLQAPEQDKSISIAESDCYQIFNDGVKNENGMYIDSVFIKCDDVEISTQTEGMTSVEVRNYQNGNLTILESDHPINFKLESPPALD